MKIFISLSAIRLSDYKKWVAPLKKANLYYEELFKRYTNKHKAYRIYLPIKGTYTERNITPLPEVIEQVEKAGYVLEDYTQGIVSKPGKKGVTKLGKVLKDKDLLDRYSSHKAKLGSKNISGLAVVISRHPYDIAGMSTDRSWVSCTRLGTSGVNYDTRNSGVRADYVLSDVKNGSLVAYLVDENDLNITRPKARVRILRYVDKKSGDFFLTLGPSVFGTAPPAFTETIKKWLDEVNVSTPAGVYCLTGGTDRLDGAAGKAALIRDVESALAALPSKTREVQIQALESGYIPEDTLLSMLKSKSVNTSLLAFHAPNLPDRDKLLFDVIKYGDSNTRIAVIEQIPSLLDEEHADALAKDKDSQVRSIVPHIPSVTVDILRDLSKDKNTYVRNAVPQSPNTTEDILRDLSKDKSHTARIEVAHAPNVTAEILGYLSKDKNTYVRISVVRSPNVTEEILRDLTKDEDRSVSRAALKYLRQRT